MDSTKFALTTFTRISTLSKTLHQHSVNSSHYQKQIISQGVELYAANSTLTFVDGKAQYNITIKNMGSVTSLPNADAGFLKEYLSG